MMLRRVFGIGLAWAVLWLAFWAIVGAIFAIVDPDSIDPGEAPMVIAAVLGPMGLLSGVAVGILLSIAGRRRPITDLSLVHVAGLGILASAVVQLAYLNHGDLGLVANLKMAALFCGFGGLVTMTWLMLARGWTRSR